MRIWSNIKENCKVMYEGEKYLVQKIYKEDLTTYGVLKNLETDKIIDVPLCGCSLIEE
ncbi:MAG: hypothetical protein IJV31_10175 [Clostridia bacterium]|nr:hypothetical protein [Clostridia bacterium]